MTLVTPRRDVGAQRDDRERGGSVGVTPNRHQRHAQADLAAAPDHLDMPK